MSPGTVAAMEGVTPSPSSSSQSDAGVAMETRFTDLCKRLDLDESLTSQGMTLFKESRTIISANISSIGIWSPEDGERMWFAFVLYCVTKFGKSNQGGGRINLFRILREVKLNAVDFFKEMLQFRSRLVICSAASIVLIGRGDLS